MTQMQHFSLLFEHTRRNVGKSSFHFIDTKSPVCIRNLVSPSERGAFHFSAHQTSSRRRRSRILPVRCKFNRDWAAIKCNLAINEWSPLRGGGERHRVRGRAEGGALGRLGRRGELEPAAADGATRRCGARGPGSHGAISRTGLVSCSFFDQPN